MTDRLAAIGVAVGWTGAGLFGFSLTELTEIARIFSLLCAAGASVAAAVYYISNRKK